MLKPLNQICQIKIKSQRMACENKNCECKGFKCNEIKLIRMRISMQNWSVLTINFMYLNTLHTCSDEIFKSSDCWSCWPVWLKISPHFKPLFYCFSSQGASLPK